MAVGEILTDAGPNFCSDKFAELLAERAIKYRRTRPCRPQTDGKACEYRVAGADSSTGCTPTISTDTTPPSETHPPAASTTSVGTTASVADSFASDTRVAERKRGTRA